MWAKCRSCGRMSNITQSVCSECIWWEKHRKKLKIEEEKERLANLTIEPMDPFLSPRCYRCDNAANEDHPCPYKSELQGDDETLCNCCDECCQECADDI